MKLTSIAKKFAKPIAFGAAGIAALGIAISSALNRKDEDDYDNYEPEEDEEDSGDYADEPEDTSEESTVDDAE